MTRAERYALAPLAIATNPTDRLTSERPGRNATRKIDKYVVGEATSEEGPNRTPRTDRAARFILDAAKLSGGTAPYAFTLPNGDPSSLDWWIVSVLKNKDELELVIGADGFVSGVRPTRQMQRRYDVDLSAVADTVAEDVQTIANDPKLTPTERWSEILSRIGQGAFRSDLMSRFGERCAVTGCDVPQLLRASHIVPWATDAALRRDPENGLLLCAHVDAAFDAHLISFSEAGEMIFSRRFPETKAKRLGVQGRLTAPLSLKAKSNLARHRARLAELDSEF